MTSNTTVLSVIPLPGLRPEALGNYLASLGLLRLLSRNWPSVRIAWRNGVLHVVGGPGSLDELLDWVVQIGGTRAWTPYSRGWLNAQKRSRKEKSGQPLALWQANAEEQELEVFCAHAVARERVEFNPLLGTGGNAGQREFAKGWNKVVRHLANPPANVDSRQELLGWLLGRPVSWMLSGVAAASWFSSANKLYNSGAKPFREEPICPWAMALACEGLSFFAGAASRRLGTRARARAAFPFICQAAAPSVPGEAGRDLAEVWAPLWERPMTLSEVRALFQRGRAEFRGRGAKTPSAFAAAIVRRGVDAGVSKFMRFALGRTTSAKTFEPRCEGSIPVLRGNGRESLARSRSTLVERILDLVEKLPADRKQGKRWRFVGLRGPIEAALVRLAQTRDEPEAVRALLDTVVSALDRVDRTFSLRAKGIFWKPLPLDYLPTLFGDEQPTLEARLALALVSRFPRSRPFTLYRFGVEWQYNRFQHPKEPPRRWVWGPGDMSRVLSRVFTRSTLDWEHDHETSHTAAEEPARNLLPLATADVGRWLLGDVDEGLMDRWLSRFALFDWRTVSPALRSALRAGARVADPVPPDAALCLFGLLQPLFDQGPLRLPDREDDLLDPQKGARTPAVARMMIALLQTGQIDAALDLTASRYAMAATPLATFDVTWTLATPDRLLASLLFPVSARERAALVQRWLRPQRKKGETTYV